MQNEVRKELFSVTEVAEIAGVGVSTIWRNVKSGKFPAPIKVCGSTRWRRADIDAVIAGEQLQSAA